MRNDFRQARLDFLRSAQNADGGWGYFPGKQSWLEPTCYSLLALYEGEAASKPWSRGWDLISSWQQPDGGFRPAAAVTNSCWATALVVSIHCVRGTDDASFRRAIGWMLGIKGTEGQWLERTVNAIRLMPVEYDRRWKGWPWIPESSSWIEPTAHSLLALKKAASKVSHSSVNERIAEAERMLMDRRSSDGGWNYGNRRVLKTDLPSYPETTGIALLGLQGSRSLDLTSAREAAQKHLETTRSPLARAWLSISLRNLGADLPEQDSPATEDVMMTALEAIASPNGGHQWLKV